MKNKIFGSYRWEFTSVRVSPCCVLLSCAFLLYIMSCLSICMFYIDCTAEIKYSTVSIDQNQREAISYEYSLVMKL